MNEISIVCVGRKFRDGDEHGDREAKIATYERIEGGWLADPAATHASGQRFDERVAERIELERVDPLGAHGDPAEEFQFAPLWEHHAESGSYTERLRCKLCSLDVKVTIGRRDEILNRWAATGESRLLLRDLAAIV